MHPVQLSIFKTALAAIFMLSAAPVLAQTPDEPASRASVLDKARESRATESAEPQRSAVARGLSWYDNQYRFAKRFGGWKGIRLAGGDFPAGAGLKFGVGYDKALTSADPDPLLTNRVDLTALGAYSTRGYARLSAGVNARNLGGSRIDLAVSGQYYEFPQEEFFGLGMDSLESNRTNYLLDGIESGVGVRWKPSRFEFGGDVAYFRPRLGRGTDNRFLSTDDLFPAAAAPGFGSDTDYLKGELSAAFDWRDNPSHPHVGGRYAIAVTSFDDRDLGQSDFYRVNVNLQQYVPLTDRYRLVALRAEGVFTTADSGNFVPFYLQPTLGGAKGLRGFRESRFRDQNSVVVGAEYRWQAWWALDAALFADAGMVAPTRRDFSFRETEVGYGIGFRFHSNSAFVGRLDLAFSREGFVPLLRFEHVF